MKKYIKLIVGFLFLGTTIVSCIDEEARFEDNGAYGIVEIFNVAAKTSSSTVYCTKSTEIEYAETVEVPIVLNYTGANAAPEDITVTLAVDNSIVGSSYVEMTSEMYNLTATTTIAKGTKKDTVMLTVKPPFLDLSNIYALGVTIASTSYGTVSSNYSKVIFPISVKNYFAGTYRRELSYFHPTAGGTYPDTPYTTRDAEVTLSTVDATTCSEWLGVWNNDLIYMTINDDNSVTVTFPSRTDAFEGDPYDSSKVSYYDPATGIIYVYYAYNSDAPRIFWVKYTPVD